MIKKAISQSKSSKSDSSTSPSKPKRDAKNKTGDKNTAKSPESTKPVFATEKGKRKEKLEETKEDFEVKDGCVFCGILKLRQVPILYEDKYCFAFYDKKKKSAKEHILMCPKDHVKNIHTVTERDMTLLKHLQSSGEALLKQMFPKDTYRFGYHEPPINSVDHLHLHCIVLPISKPFYERMLYGTQLSPTSKFITKFERIAALRKAAIPTEPEEIDRD